MKILISSVILIILNSCSSRQVISVQPESTLDANIVNEIKKNRLASVEKVKPMLKNLDLAIQAQQFSNVNDISLRILSLNPQNTVALNALAVASLEAGKLEKSRTLLNKVLLIDPQSAEAYNNLGLVFLAEDQVNQSLEMFQKSLELKPNNIQAVSNLVSYYILNQDFTKVNLLIDPLPNKKLLDAGTLKAYATSLAAVGRTIDIK